MGDAPLTPFVLHSPPCRLKQVALAKVASFLAANKDPRLAALKDAFAEEGKGGGQGGVAYDKVRARGPLLAVGGLQHLMPQTP